MIKCSIPVSYTHLDVYKRQEIGKTSISKRKTISATMMRDVKSMLRDYFDIMDLSLIHILIVCFVIVLCIVCQTVPEVRPT